MKCHLLVPLLASVVFVLCCNSTAFGQSDPNLEQGLKPYGSYHGGDIDVVSMATGNLTVKIPLLSYPQRGKLHLGSELVYNAKNYQFKQICTPNGCTDRWSRLGGVFDSGVVAQWDIKNSITSVAIQPDPQHIFYIDAVKTADGSSHTLGHAATGTSEESVDATGLDGSLIDSQGIIYTNGICEEDPNGNKLCTNAGQDSLGRTIPALPTAVTSNTTDYSKCTGTLPIVSASTWNPPGPSGGTSAFEFCYASVYVILSINLDDNSQVTGYTRMLQSVVLPDNTTWTFQYTNDGWADLSQIAFPTGGTLSYTWNGNVLQCVGPGLPSNRVASRTLNSNDGTGNHTWNYTWTSVGSGVFSAVVTDPATPTANDAVYTITPLGGSTSCSLYATAVQYYQGSHTSGTLLKTVATTYSWTASPFSTYMDHAGQISVINVVPTTITTTWANGKTSKVTKTYDTGFTYKDPNPQSTNTYTALYGLVTSESDYDYGNNQAGPLLRSTSNTYLALSNSSYLNNNMLSLKSQVATFAGSPGTGACGSNGAIACTTYGYDETTPVSSGVTTQHDSNPPAGVYRGNQTSVKSWLNGSTVSTTLCPVSISNGNLTTTRTIYDTGMVSTSKDPCGNTTTYTYDPAYVGAYVTKTQSPATNSPNLAQHIISGTYDFDTGLLSSFTDQNNNTSNFNYDSMWRFTTASFPDTGETDFFYPDVNTVERTQKIDATRKTDLYVRFDGLGREMRRITANDESTPWDQVDTCYDAVGNESFVSYPYQGTGLGMSQICSGTGDAFGYDAMHRKTSVTHSDGTSATTTYTGAAVKVSDEGNGTKSLQRVSQADGLGRLVSVCEVSGTTLLGITPTPAGCGQDITATGFLTTYSYDALGNLQLVTQGGLNHRSFVYNSLSQLTSITNPESGQTQYSYDADMNAVSRTAPAPNQTGSGTVISTFTYDQLNRLLSKSYNDGSTPAATFNYDETSAKSVSLLNTTGRQSSVLVKNAQAQLLAEEVFSYDTMGRAKINSQCTPQNCASGVFPLTYNYDFSGDMTTSTNGMGVTLTDQFNRALRLTQTASSLSDSNHPGTLVSGLHYSAFGTYSTGTLGNGLPETATITARGWLQSISVGTGGSVYSLSIASYAPDGDVLQANDNVNGNWVYTYDDFNRLATANKNTNQQAFSYAYDRFGNRWQQNVTAGTGPNPSYAFDANNRITTTGVTYDAAGNARNDGAHAYFYDAENRIIQVGGTLGTCSSATACYVYDAEGRRVRKTTGSVSVDYVYDLAGNAVAEVSSSGGWNRGEVFAGAHHLATYTGGTGGNTYFIHADYLGSERARTNVSGAAVETCTSLPFGDGQSCTGTDVSPLHFTGKQRDTETGNDDFGARYLNSGMGRWLTPDWSTRREAVPYADPSNPQTLNLYAYVGNNPTSRADLDGHAAGGNGCTRPCETREADSMGPLNQTDESTINEFQEVQFTFQAQDQSTAPVPNTQAQQIPGTPITITNFEGLQYPNGGGGVAIGATANCSDCTAWVQTIRRTGPDDAFGREFVDKGNTAVNSAEYYSYNKNPVYGGGNHFSDMPGSNKGGIFNAVVWAGSADLKNKTFTTHAAFAYGFSVSKSGKLTVTAPRAATKAQRAHSLATIRADSSPWTIN